MRFVGAGGCNVVVAVACDDDEDDVEWLVSSVMCSCNSNKDNKTNSTSDQHNTGDDDDDSSHARCALRMRARALLQRGAVLRLRRRAPAECAVCGEALVAFVGVRLHVALDAAARARLCAIVPAAYHDRVADAHVALLLPDYTRALQTTTTTTTTATTITTTITSAAAAVAPRGVQTSFTVEVKPKAAWLPPRVVGIVVDGQRHMLHHAKQHQCYYSLRQLHKAQQMRQRQQQTTKTQYAVMKEQYAAATAAAAAAATAVLSSSTRYCPNMLYSRAASTHDALQRLLHMCSYAACAQHYNQHHHHHDGDDNKRSECTYCHHVQQHTQLRVLSRHITRAVGSNNDNKHDNDAAAACASLPTSDELRTVARAMDASGVLPTLAYLQLYGKAPPSRPQQRQPQHPQHDDEECATAHATHDDDDDDDVCVLDVELLARWAAAGPHASVQWLWQQPTPSSSPSSRQRQQQHHADSMSSAEDVYGGADEAALLTRLGRASCACTLHSRTVTSSLRSAAATTAMYTDAVTEYVATPPLLGLQTCIARFYAAMTARDVSLLVSVQTPVTATDADGALSNSNNDSSDTKSSSSSGDMDDDVRECVVCVPATTVADGALARCRVAVVDLDCKRHKPLAHYAAHDAAILAAYDEHASVPSPSVPPH